MCSLKHAAACRSTRIFSKGLHPQPVLCVRLPVWGRSWPQRKECQWMALGVNTCLRGSGCSTSPQGGRVQPDIVLQSAPWPSGAMIIVRVGAGQASSRDRFAPSHSCTQKKLQGLSFCATHMPRELSPEATQTALPLLGTWERRVREMMAFESENLMKFKVHIRAGSCHLLIPDVTEHMLRQSDMTEKHTAAEKKSLGKYTGGYFSKGGGYEFWLLRSGIWGVGELSTHQGTACRAMFGLHARPAFSSSSETQTATAINSVDKTPKWDCPLRYHAALLVHRIDPYATQT